MSLWFETVHRGTCYAITFFESEHRTLMCKFYK
jgi:hypothetical protein